MHRILLIEDSEEDASRLRRCIERYFGEKDERFQLTVMKSAMEFISAGGTWSLVFMDIDLPGINGLEAAELLRSYDPVTPLVFVTNLAQYAVRGYEVDALDFIVKPVSYYDFKLRMDKAMRAVRRQQGRAAMVKTGGGVRLVPIADLVYVEVFNHNLAWHISGEKEPLVARGTLSAIEGELASASLVRVSNSCLVNVDYVRFISGNDLRLVTGETLQFSRTRRRGALKAMADYLGGSI